MRLLALLFLLLAPVTAMAQDNPIINAMTALARHYNAGEMDQLAALYAPDAVLLLPGRQAILGREAIIAHYTQTRADGTRDVQVKTFDIRPLGDKAAIEIGETVLMQGDQRVVGRYMHMWEVLDGQILITREMFHVLKVD